MLLTVLVSVLLGFLTGLGTGGGSLLILWMTAIAGISQADARLINLLFFIPSAFISCLFHHKQGQLDFKKMLPAIIAGSISAGLFAYWSQNWNIELLKRLFGVLLILTAVRELCYRPKN